MCSDLLQQPLEINTHSLPITSAFKSYANASGGDPLYHLWNPSCRGFWEMLLSASWLQYRKTPLKGLECCEYQLYICSTSAWGATGGSGWQSYLSFSEGRQHMAEQK